MNKKTRSQLCIFRIAYFYYKRINMSIVIHDTNYDFTIEKRDDGPHVFIKNKAQNIAVAKPLPRIQLPSDAKIHLTGCFANSPILRDVRAFDGIPNDNIVDTSGMFENCPCLRASGLDSPFFREGFPNCTDMHKMFSGCRKLYGLPFSGDWNVSKVTDMSYMFFGCRRLSWRSMNAIEYWNTSSVINMTGMFGNTTTRNLPMMYILSRFHVNECNIGQVICWGGTIMPIHLSQYYNVIPTRGVMDTLPIRVLRHILRPLPSDIRILRRHRFNNAIENLVYYGNPFSEREDRIRAMESENVMDAVSEHGFSDSNTYSDSRSDDE